MPKILNDPEMQALAAALTAPGVPNIANATPTELRALMAALRPAPSVNLKSVLDETVTRSDGTAIKTRRYVPEGPLHGTILYFHGGGWTIGSIEDYDHFVRLFALATSCAILSVDYRLAPEHVFPAAVEDAWTVLRAERSDKPLIVAGDSAGGNLSAVIAQMAQNAGGPEIAGQILIYPFVDGDMDAPALSAFEPPVLGRDEITTFVDLYVPDRTQRGDPRFSPIMTEDLRDLPPAMIVTAEADLLATQAEIYTQRLRDAGVKVDTYCQVDGVHAYLSLAPDSVAATETMRHIGFFVADITSDPPRV